MKFLLVCPHLSEDAAVETLCALCIYTDQPSAPFAEI